MLMLEAVASWSDCRSMGQAVAIQWGGRCGIGRNGRDRSVGTRSRYRSGWLWPCQLEWLSPCRLEWPSVYRWGLPSQYPLGLLSPYQSGLESHYLLRSPYRLESQLPYP